MASALYKAVRIDNFNPGNDAGNSLYYGWGTDIVGTDTPWLAMWCDLAALAPNPPGTGGFVNPETDLSIGASGWPASTYLAYLDNQIKRARQLGFKVLLTLYRYPGWMNGTGVPDRPELPTDVSASSPWALYFWFLINRYGVYNPTAAQNGTWVDLLEICNEPNLTNTQLQSDKTAEMMYVANYIRFTSGLNAPVLAGPALADNNSWSAFADRVLARLSSTWFFKGNYWFAWSMHNYIDIGDRQGGWPSTSPTTARAQQMRAKLVSIGWQGWPLQAEGDAYTCIIHTEGGGLSSDRQNKVPAAYNLWRSDTATGRGLLMFTQFLNVTNPNFNSGLREQATYVPPYNARNLRANWTALPHS